jgi:hypothetical protein
MIEYYNSSIELVDVRRLVEKPSYDWKKEATLHIIYYDTDLPKCLELKDAVASNPYHFYFYMISRFYYFDNYNSPIQYLYEKTNDTFSEEALASLPKRFQRLYQKEKDIEYVQLPGCLWHPDSISEPWMYSYVRDLYKHIWESVPKEKGKFVYISRKNARTRRVEQEDEVQKILVSLGFKIYYLETMTFEEQIKLFRSAEIIVGAHGAGLAHLIFCESQTYVVEINCNIEEKNHYAHLATSCKLYYLRFIGCTYNEKEELIHMDLPLFENAMNHVVRSVSMYTVPISYTA